MKDRSNSKVTLILPVRRAGRQVERCLRSICAGTVVPEILVMDCTAEPGALERVKREFPGVRIVARSREEETAARPRISVFSNVDVLLKKRSDETARAREREAERRGTAVGDDGDGTREEEDRESSFSVVYEANGRCEPFNVSVFRDGADERDGLNIAIGRFGRPVTGD